MSDFKREERYTVVKHKDLSAAQLPQLRSYLAANDMPTRTCVVVEPDWPIYEQVWQMVESLSNGRVPINPKVLAADLNAALEREKSLSARIEFLNQQNTEQQEQNDALAAYIESLSSNAVALANACENKTDLPLHKWAVKCAMLVNRVYKAAEEKPTTTLARHDANTLREYADKLEADEAPDAEAGDMWDARQCADWMREQADKAEAQQ